MEGVGEDLEGDDTLSLFLLWDVVSGHLVVEESRLGEGGRGGGREGGRAGGREGGGGGGGGGGKEGRREEREGGK